MKNKKYSLPLLGISLIGILFYACNPVAKSRPNFVYKSAPKTGIVAKIEGKEITEQELLEGIEGEIFEEENKIFEMKMNRLRGLVLKIFMENDPNKKGLSNDEYLEKYIAKNIKISDKDINEFIAERKIPSQHINDQLKERINKFLMQEKQKEAVDIWLTAKTDKNPVEVYLPRPIRPVFDVVVGESPFTGAADAKVTIVEFSDFQCPFCSKASSLVKKLKEKYKDKIKVVFKHYPLPFHEHAQGAALASLCANDQSTELFWKMHYAMFDDQSKLDLTALEATAKKAGVDITKYSKCMGEKKFQSLIDKDMAQAQKLGLKSTPTFFVNGMLINGAQPVEVFTDLIDSELAK